MKVVNQDEVEIQEYDLETGHLVDHKLLVAHHDAVEPQAAVYEDQLVEEYENGGKLYNHVCVKEGVVGQDAWDEYEDVLMYVPYTEEELAEIEEQKKQEEEAAAAAEEEQKKLEEEAQAEKRMNVAVRTMAMAMMPSLPVETMSTASLAPLAPLYPEWDSNSHEYKKGEPFYYVIDGETHYFRASQNTTSTNVYKPGDPGIISIYYEFFIAPDGIEIYQEAVGEFNSYDKGDKCHYPDADGPIYESLVNDNAYSPDAYPANWKKVSE